MSDSDDLQALLARTRAGRDRLNRHLTDIGKPGSSRYLPIRRSIESHYMCLFAGESPHPVRSPLREKNLTSTVAPTSPSKIKVGKKERKKEPI